MVNHSWIYAWTNGSLRTIAAPLRLTKNRPRFTYMNDEISASQVLRLPLGAIRPNPAQPRQRFDEAGLDELAASLREHGVLQPVLVHPLGDGAYELIAGERRWQAARRAGLAALPAL